MPYLLLSAAVFLDLMIREYGGLQADLYTYLAAYMDCTSIYERYPDDSRCHAHVIQQNILDLDSIVSQMLLLGNKVPEQARCFW